MVVVEVEVKPRGLGLVGRAGLVQARLTKADERRIERADADAITGRLIDRCAGVEPQLTAIAPVHGDVFGEVEITAEFAEAERRLIEFEWQAQPAGFEPGVERFLAAHGGQVGFCAMAEE